MMDQSSPDTPAAAAEPLDDVWEAVDIPDTKWPKVIGIISLIYAIGGLLCQVGGVGWLLVGVPLFAGMAGVEIEVPAILIFVMIPQALLGLALGVMLLLGAVNLLRRHRSAVGTLKAWVVLRLILLVIGVGAGILTLPAQITLQEQAMEAQVQRAEERGSSIPPGMLPDREALWTRGLIGTAVVTGLAAVYPLFLGFYLSRRKIDDEVAQWK
ncbi:MAG: hypothetical protein SYC29_02760 [Planctomycetota bacterium]|nr:hypothetical protein [Planctomycetota bacterium]